VVPGLSSEGPGPSISIVEGGIGVDWNLEELHLKGADESDRAEVKRKPRPIEILLHAMGIESFGTNWKARRLGGIGGQGIFRRLEHGPGLE